MKRFQARSIPVKLDEATLKKIDELAARIGESRSTVMRLAMRLGIEALQDLKVDGATITRLLTLRPPDAASTWPEHREQYSTAEERPEPPKPVKPKKSKAA